jgi:hypothetical protein
MHPGADSKKDLKKSKMKNYHDPQAGIMRGVFAFKF